MKSARANVCAANNPSPDHVSDSFNSDSMLIVVLMDKGRPSPSRELMLVYFEPTARLASIPAVLKV